MTSMRYVVTGGTGFMGRRVVSQLLQTSPDAEVDVLVRRTSLPRFERLAVEWPDRAHPVIGDLAEPGLGLPDETLAEMAGVEHIVHCGTVHDPGATESAQRRINIESTRSVIALAKRLDATLHHVSSIAVAGDFRGEFTEDDFDLGQNLPTPYHRTKFEAEQLVVDEPGLRYRVYRPGVVVGDSRTGEMDKIDGPYYLFPLLAKLAKLPSATPIILPETGRTNIVPIDYVVEALTWLMHARGQDGHTFHLTSPDSVGLHHIYRGVAPAAGLPPLRGALPRSVVVPALKVRGRTKVARNVVATQLGIPPEVLDVADSPTTFNSDATRETLQGSGIAIPKFDSYAPQLWRYWAEYLDVDRARRDHPDGPLVGKHVIITGASSGIGRASALAVTQRGATVFALARNGQALDELIGEIHRSGGTAYAFTCDITDSSSVEHTIKDILGQFGHVDYLVNSAGRSIRRSVANSTERLHDYERVMAVNYFGAVRVVLALLPHWRGRRFGHVVNVSSVGAQARNPQYSAYIPSKAALDAFSEVVASETLSDHVTFTNIHMPLVRTPMIAPSRRLNPQRPISPQRAAAMVVRALVEKPTRIDSPYGTIAEAGNYFTPRLARRVMHHLYLLYPDSAAARGEVSTDEPSAKAPPRRPKRPARGIVRRLRAPRRVKRTMRLVPGVHW